MTQPISNFQELFAHMNYLLEHSPESELEDIAALPVLVQDDDGTVTLEVNGIEMLGSGLFLTTGELPDHLFDPPWNITPGEFNQALELLHSEEYRNAPLATKLQAALLAVGVVVVDKEEGR